MIPVIGNKWLTLGVAVAAFTAGCVVTTWRWKADERDQLAAAMSARTDREAKLNERAEKAEDQLAKIAHENRSLSRRIANETRADTYRCPVPTGGVRLLEQARSGVEPDPTGQPDGQVP